MKNKKETLSFSNFRIMFMAATLALFGSFALVSCSDNEAASPDTSSQFVGDYEVEDISQGSGYVYNYDVSISRTGTNQIQISNFADMFNVPIKANVNGMSFTIPKQSFTNPSGKSISVSGTGTLSGDILTFQYTTAGFLDYVGSCEAQRYQ